MLYFFRMFRDELNREGVPNIERIIGQGFQNWFRNHVSLIYIQIVYVYFNANFVVYILIYVYFMHLIDL